MTTSETPRQRVSFPLGKLVMSSGVSDYAQLGTAETERIAQVLRRHAKGDWGDMAAEDLAQNDDALAQGARLFSAYDGPDGVRLYVITEADRSVTTVLLPDEY